MNIIRENSKFFWSFANSKRKIKSRIPPLRKENGSLTEDPKEKAELLQTQYTSVFSDPSKVTVRDCIDHLLEPNIFISDLDFTPECLESALAELDPYCGSPPGDIPAGILHRCRAGLVRPLWNKTYIQGRIPSCLKTQYITPIFKKGTRSDASNYRPVSLTSNIIKSFERVVRKQLVAHLEAGGFISTSQHGFRSGRSTLTQLLAHLDNVLRNLNNGNEVDVIYVDFEKALDKVSIDVLLAKLKKCGVRGKLLDWINDFLGGRVQTVRVDGHFSSFQKVISGVPQGSVLGPILFLVYVMDLDQCLAKAGAFTFADDTKIFMAFKSCSDQVDLKRDLNQVFRWAVANNMNLHENKFELMSYTLAFAELVRELPFSGEWFTYDTPGGTVLEPSSTVKDLGIILSCDGSWKPHIDRIAKSAATVANWILGAFKDRSPGIMLLLYKALVRPILEYCCVVWSPETGGEIAKLEQVQCNFTRRISGCRGKIYWDRLYHLNLQSLQRRRDRYSMIQVWKTYNNLIPNSTQMKFYENARLGPRAVIPPYNYSAQKSKASLLEASFGVRGGQLWNTLPENIKVAPSLEALKARLGHYLAEIPDWLPTTSYSIEYNNFLLEWARRRGAQ